MQSSKDAEPHVLSARPQRPFQFVAVQPNAQKRWLGSSKAVRSNATQHQWKQFKEVRPHGRKSRVVLQSDPKKRIAVSPLATIRSVEQSSRDRHPPRNDEQLIFASHQVTETPIQRPISYHPYPSTLPIEVVGSLFDFVRQIAPQVCGSGSNSKAPLEMIRHLLSHQGTFHASVFAIASLQDELRPSTFIRPRHDRVVLEACQLIAVTNVRTLISNISSTPSNTKATDLHLLISMVTALSTQTQDEEDPGQRSQRYGPRQAPFGKLDALHQLGSRKRYHNIHTNASIKLIELAGGIDSVPEFHRITNSALSIILATRLLNKPRLPCCVSNPDYKEVLESYRTNVWAKTIAFPEGIVQDVERLGTILSHRLLSIIDNLWLCMRMTDCRLHQSDFSTHASYLVDARKSTQHSLLSLPTSAELNATRIWQSHLLTTYEATRLGLNIFSLLAVYPMPLSGAPFAMLASKLAFLLSSYPLDTVGNQMQQLSLWVSMMGGIAAIGTRKRAFFVDIIATDSHKLHLHTWSQLRSLLQGYLWYAEISDFDGQTIWLEVQQHNKTRPGFGSIT